MKLASNFFLLTLLLLLLALPLSVMDFAYVAPDAREVLSNSSVRAVPQVPVVPPISQQNVEDVSTFAPQYVQESTQTVVSPDEYDYYQLPPLYLTQPDTVE